MLVQLLRSLAHWVDGELPRASSQGNRGSTGAGGAREPGERAVEEQGGQEALYGARTRDVTL